MLLLDSGGMFGSAIAPLTSQPSAYKTTTAPVYSISVERFPYTAYRQANVSVISNTYDFTLEDAGLMVDIPGGTFQMGDEVGDMDEDCRPVHTVTLSAYKMDKYEITNEQYCAYLNVALLLEEIVVSDNGFYVFGFEGEYDGQRYLQMSHLGHEYTRCWIEFDGTRFYVVPGHEDWPVVYVTWVGSKMFALSWGCDLPTEAEWEYAARSGEQFLYATDDGTLDDTKANYNYNVGNVASVGIYPANQFGLYDMSGNVWEWCSDFYGEYSSENMFDPIGPLDGKETILRGGCWSTTYITHCRTARRAKTATLMLNDHFGFRVVQRIGNITY